MSPADAAASAALPLRGLQGDALPGAATWGLAALACAAGLAVLLWSLRKRMPGLGYRSAARPHAIDLLDSRLVAPQVRLVVVGYGQRRLLCAVTPAGLQCLRDDQVGDSGNNDHSKAEP